jgi:hypothetical protein
MQIQCLTDLNPFIPLFHAACRDSQHDQVAELIIA